MSAELVVDVFVSVDGWAGGDRLPGFFGYFGDDLARWTTAERRVPETVIMGRRTYEAFLALPPAAWSADREPLMRQDKVVFSRTLQSVVWPNTRIGRDLATEIRDLKNAGQRRLRTWGSMSLAGQLLEAGLVDVLRLMRFPLIAGPSGRQSAFEGVPSVDLELIRTLVLDDRIVLEEYRPTGRDIPRA
ncbi:dihydrofolate reductase family protein [Leifsonia sp. P73]|uniref:dihydrofolate reductase family protein n=1 Tax=Leifsonia sp. P73 TaxID=3423959 RepID=UPI003DA3DA29